MSPKTHSTYANTNVVRLAFTIGQSVRIKALDDVKGTVYSCVICRDGIEYMVKWFNDNTRLQDWFQGVELEVA